MCLRYSLLPVVLIAVAAAKNCTTPNNEQAECIPLSSCRVLIDALATKKNGSIEYLRQSTCGISRSNPLVCCGSFYNLETAKSNLESKIEIAIAKRLLPDKSYCGFQHTDDYFRFKNGTAIDEFPWSALLLFNINGKLQGQCSGSLISNRYVLTVGHCVSNNSTAYKNFVGVRLGEYHVSNKTDCIDEQFYECSEQPKDFGVEQVIVHRNHNSRNHLHNIALIRLNRIVEYSDYIRPICLPLPGTQLANVGDSLTTTGWGKTKFGGSATETKKKISNKLITNKDCAAADKAYESYLTKDHFCTLESNMNIEFSCSGDSGGPVMYSVKKQWHQEGIISFARGCHNGRPVVHTKVINYLDWIVKNIRP